MITAEQSMSTAENGVEWAEKSDEWIIAVSGIRNK